MKLFSFVLSVAMFFISLYFFVLKILYIDTLNDVIYVSLLVVLMAICVVGVMVNWEIFEGKSQSRLVLFVANSFYRKKKNKKK
jgi:hypothetical protein